jgi:rhodanese-related sulfurtransferase
MFANLMNRLGGATSQMQSLNVQELNDWLKENKKVVLLDVRSAEEYNHHGRINKTKLIPLDLLSQRLSELNPDDTIVCVCRSGNRSSFACDTLQRAGFQNVYNLTGGMIAWERAGYKVTR